ncbi:uncharacterized protein PITG_20131, partial [Phytophthora infestans T30-4]
PSRQTSHAEQDAERGQEIMEIDELESLHVSGQPVQRRCQLKIEEEIDGNQHRRQVVVQKEMLQLQTTQKRIETNYRLIESRIQSKQDQRIGEMQQQTDTQLRDFGNRFKSTQAELPQRVETLVKLSLERRNDSLQDQLQQKLLEAQAQHLRDIESKNQNSLAAISAKLDKAAGCTAWCGITDSSKNVKTFVRRAAVRALEALLRAHAGDTVHASSKKDQFDIYARGTDSSSVVRAQSIKSLSAILLKFSCDEEAHNL